MVQAGRLHGKGTIYYTDSRRISGYWEEGIYKQSLLSESVKPTTPEVAPPADGPSFKVWAVIVGIASYSHLQVLRYTDDDAYRSRAEARLFGSAETKVVLWSDFKRNAAVNTNWPLHKTSALDDLKADSLAVVELVLALEEKFGIEIPDEDTEQIKTVQDAINYIKTHRK